MCVLPQRSGLIQSLGVNSAHALHNTPTICRTSYVHPAILGLADKATDLERVRTAILETPARQLLRADENRLMAFLQAAPAFPKTEA